MALFMIHSESQLPFCVEPTAIESIEVGPMRISEDPKAIGGGMTIPMRSGNEIVCRMKTLRMASELRDRLHRLSSDPRAKARPRPPPTLRAMREARLSPR